MKSGRLDRTLSAPVIIAGNLCRPATLPGHHLQGTALRLLSQAHLDPVYQCGDPNLMLTADQMTTLPALFNTIGDPRRTQGKRHRLATILAIAAAAILCGRIGYKGIAQWAQALGQSGPATMEPCVCARR